MVVAVLAALLAGCGVSAGDAAARLEDASPTGRSGDERLVAAGEDSLAVVDTPFSSGSAVLVDGGYLVTNAHVVDPFDEVQLRFADGQEELAVPVVGVDLVADLAVLGPIETEHPALAVGDPDALTSGDAIHLIGYPGDQEDGPELELESGRYARHQYPKNWDLDYLQANVDIEAGQSGGAMVDDEGRLVGISALELDDGVALSLSVEDVERIVDEIIADEVEEPASDWSPVPHTQGEREHRVDIDGPDDVHAFFVSGAAFADELDLTVSDPEARVVVASPGFYGVVANDAARAAAEEGGFWSLVAFDDVDPLELDDEGSIALEVEEGEDLLVLVGSDRPATVDLRTSPGSAELPIVPEAKPIAVGDAVEASVGYLDALDVYEVDLAAGDRITIDAESASGDMAFLVAGPGQPWYDAPGFDETGSPHSGPGGMLGLDEHTELAAAASGTHTIVVYAADDTPTAYRLTLADA